MASGLRQAQFAQQIIAFVHLDGLAFRPRAQGLGIGPDVGLARQPVGHHAAIQTRDDPADLGVVRTEHGRAVERHPREELDERLAEAVEVRIVIDVLVVDVGDDRDGRHQVQEAAVALVGLRQQVFAAAEHGVGPQGAHAAAHDHRRIQIAGREHGGGQAGGRRLAVRPRDRDADLQAHEFGEHLRPADHGDPAPARLADLAVGFGDGRRADHDIGAGDLVGRVPLVDARPQTDQTLGDIRLPQIAAADGEPQIQQDLGDPAHADAADGDQMNVACIPEHGASLRSEVRGNPSARRRPGQTRE